MADALSAPNRLSLLLETRTAIDLLAMLGPLALAGLRAPRVREDGPVVVVIPGFGTDGRYMAPLRHYLARRGHACEDWGLGRNLAGVNLRHRLDDVSPAWEIEPRENYRGEASVPILCDRLMQRLSERHAASGRRIALVGWSLGGYVARECARDLPDVVERVITLGSPTIGGPKYTQAAGFFRGRGMDLDWIEAVVQRRGSRPIRQPITAIYSRSDGVVSWRASVDECSPKVRHIEVSAAHMGLPFNPRVWRHVGEALEAPLST